MGFVFCAVDIDSSIRMNKGNVLSLNLNVCNVSVLSIGVKDADISPAYGVIDIHSVAVATVDFSYIHSTVSIRLCTDGNAQSTAIQREGDGIAQEFMV